MIMEKYERIGRRVYWCSRRKDNPLYWDCGYAWGPTPRAAAMIAHQNGCALSARTIKDYKNENWINKRWPLNPPRKRAPVRDDDDKK